VQAGRSGASESGGRVNILATKGPYFNTRASARSWLSAARRKMRRFIANLNDLWVFSLENCACTLNSRPAKNGGGAEQIILSQVALVSGGKLHFPTVKNIISS